MFKCGCFLICQHGGITLVAVAFFYYVVSGGFRTVVGLAFLGVIIPAPLFPMLLLPLEFAHFINMLPILKHSIFDLLLGAREATLSFIGAELLLLFYPFLKNKEDTQKWSQLAVFTTTTIYLIIMIVSLSFFSEEQLNKTIWATLTLYKVVQLPFLERFEYVGISMWMFLIAPNIGILLWAATRCAKVVFKMSQRKALIIAVVLVGIACIMLPSRQEIKIFNEIIGEIGFYFMYVYIPLLVILQTVALKIRRNKHGQSTSA
ncbi:GerAB/ArcD/ProY family transporter [Alkalihalobacillus hemicellulosilyticus]|nr:GerAB/ArcD/ProY family transporter [Halalkalibacter hemicellulosilyticus]